jgi:hypothetical protein
MGELYLRGSKSEAILAEAVCVGAPLIRDAVVIPEILDELLVERLAELPDEQGVNRRLFTFLDERASDRVFQMFIELHPTILRRYAIESWRLSYDPKTLVHARAHRCALLPRELCLETELRLESALLEYADASFLDHDDILALIKPTRLLRLAAQMRDRLLAEIPAMAKEVASNADLDIDPSDNFDDLRSTMTSLEELFADDEVAKHLLEAADNALNTETAKVAEKKKKRDEENATEDDWEDVEPGQSSPTANAESAPTPRAVRSIFSDVDD